MNDKEKEQEIEKIYQEYSEKIKQLAMEQNQLMKEFADEVQNAKLEEIRKKIGG